jgi:hypothetical protein
MWKPISPILTGMCLLLAASTPAADQAKADDALVLAFERSYGGDGADVDKFTVAKDGIWKFTPQSGEGKHGKLSVADLHQWVKEIENGGLYKVKSNPGLGGTDESFLDITLKINEKKTRVRISMREKLAQSIDNKIVELVKRSVND